MRAWIFFPLLACLFYPAQAEEFCELPPCGGIPARIFSARVIAVLDGDTVLVQRGTRNRQPVKVRLAGIDAPEKEQAYGMDSKRSLSELALKQQVRVSVQATDDYGRLVAHLVADGRSINEEQVRRGMAWEYSRFRNNRQYLALQDEARQARRGLWAQPDPMPPQQWRKLHAVAQPPQRTPVVRGYACGSKRHCSQMVSCDEARFHLMHCKIKTLDQDGDGTPCESLCAGKK